MLTTQFVAKQSVVIEDSTVDVILNCANGDMRKAVTLLQVGNIITSYIYSRTTVIFDGRFMCMTWYINREDRTKV